MKIFGLIIGLAALLILIGLTGSWSNSREFTTTDKEAYDLYVLGNEHLFAFQYRQAIAPLTQALNIDPGFAMAEATLALAYRRVGDTQQASIHLVRADSLVQHLSDDEERMIIQLRLSEFADFKACKRDSLQRAIEAINPDNLFLLISRYIDALQRNDVAGQEKSCRKMLEVDPNYANAYNLLGYVEYFRGNYAEAITMMQKYAFVAPDIANPHDSLGDVLSSIGRYEEAEDEFMQVLKMQPDFFASIVNLGRIYLEQGKIKKGVKVLEQFRDQIAETDMALNTDVQLTYLYMQHPIPEHSDMAMVRFITTYPENHNAPMMRVYRKLHNGDFADAAAVQDSLLSEFRGSERYQKEMNYRNFVDAFECKANACAASGQGDYTTAAAEWGKCLQLRRDRPPHQLCYLRERFADALMEIDRPEQAMQELNLVLKINPRRLRALASAITAQLELDNFDKASKYLAALEKALHNADSDYPAREKAAQFYDHLTSLAAGS